MLVTMNRKIRLPMAVRGYHIGSVVGGRVSRWSVPSSCAQTLRFRSIPDARRFRVPRHQASSTTRYVTIACRTCGLIAHRQCVYCCNDNVAAEAGGRKGPVYRAIADAIDEDVQSGALRARARAAAASRPGRPSRRHRDHHDPRLHRGGAARADVRPRRPRHIHPRAREPEDAARRTACST